MSSKLFIGRWLFWPTSHQAEVVAENFVVLKVDSTSKPTHWASPNLGYAVIQSYISHNVINLVNINVILFEVFLHAVVLVQAILPNACFQTLKLQLPPLLSIFSDSKQRHLRLDARSPIISISFLRSVFIAQLPQLLSLPIQWIPSRLRMARVVNASFFATQSQRHIVWELQFVVQVAIVVWIADIRVSLLEQLICTAAGVLCSNRSQPLYKTVLLLVWYSTKRAVYLDATFAFRHYFVRIWVLHITCGILFMVLVLLYFGSNASAAHLGLNKVKRSCFLMFSLRKCQFLHCVVRIALVEGSIGKMGGVILS